jgi:hypothetical protein
MMAFKFQSLERRKNRSNNIKREKERRRGREKKEKRERERQDGNKRANNLFLALDDRLAGQNG